MSNDLRELSHLLKLKGFERKWLMPVSRHYLDIHLEGLSSATENINLNSSQYLIQDLNWTPPKHKSEVQNFSLFCDGMPCRLVIGNHHLGTTYWSHVQGSSSPRRMPGTDGCVSI